MIERVEIPDHIRRSFGYRATLAICVTVYIAVRALMLPVRFLLNLAQGLGHGAIVFGRWVRG